MAENQLKEVAARIRELRGIAGLSEEEVAARTDVSVAEYRTLENGEADFSFTFIYKCAAVFGVEMKDLLEGSSPNLSLYTLTRKGDGLPLARRTGFVYHDLAPSFRRKLAEPFWVKVPYTDSEELVFSSHAGQEVDIVIKGKLMVQINDRVEILCAGDTIYYNSSAPHALRALDGKDCELYAIVLKPGAGDDSFRLKPEDSEQVREVMQQTTVADAFIETETDENGALQSIRFKNEERFNFAFDVVDKLASKCPLKTAMLWVSGDGEAHTFTFADMKKYSAMTANYFASLGIRRGDRVMVVLKRHYQFWFTMLALHKLGAIAIPATNQLVEHDFAYRYEAAGVAAIVCTADGDVANQAERGAADRPDLIKVLVGGRRAGWHDYNSEMVLCSDVFERTADTPCGNDPMVMLFTSGTTGYPRIAQHSYRYALGHYITAKYWHRVDPNGLHLTISDTGWGKALWGKLYGQWLCEAPIFTYDFDRFHPEDILPMFAQYHITTFCAPPTMYRFFIKEDLSKYDLSSVKHATTAGEALNPEVYYQFEKATGLRIVQGFGQTETTLVIGDLAGGAPRLGSMGKPTPLYDVVVLDADGNETRDGEPGEICIRAPYGEGPCGLFGGYYRDEEHTREAWHDGFYHTGDQACRDEDGYLWYVGRIDDVIKSSGYRIGPFEIESILMELPYVLECAITGVPDPVRGQVVKATVVLTAGTVGDDALKKEMQEYVKTHTAPYKYPRVVEFVTELPKTISGKVRRVEIRERDRGGM